MRINLLKIMGISAIILLDSPAFSMDAKWGGSGELLKGNMLWQQVQVQKVVTGIILDEKNQPVPGVGVKNETSGKGTVTDGSGKFSIEANPAEILRFSYIGYKTQTVTVGNQSSYNIKLVQSSNTDLDDVVVVGYGTVKKSDLTGSVGVVKATELQERPASSLNQALAGRIAGVQVNTNSGRPGGQTNIKIRGFSSINTSNNPLYVIDGIALPVGTQTQNSSAIDYINPNDIASVEVLKDASSTAIYGARGANGVILITTKKGTPNSQRITYDADFGINTLAPHHVEMLDAFEYVKVQDLAYQNIKVYDPVGWAAGAYASTPVPKTLRASLPQFFNSNGDPLYNTDWLQESIQHKLSQNHQVGFTGGNDNNTYGVFVGYRDDQGLLLNSYLKRYSGRFNFDSKIKPWLKVGGNLSYNNQDENIVDQGTGGLNSVRMITEAFPFLPVKLDNGTWGDNKLIPWAEGGSNPVHILTDQKYGMITQTSLGSVYSIINFTKDLEFRSQLGANIVSRNINEYNAKQLYGISDGQNGTANVTNDRETFWSFENYLTYKKRFAEDHSINALLGLSWQATNFFSSTGHAENFVTDFFGDNNLGSGSKSITVGSNRNRYAFNSYFGRINYSFKDKYLVTFTGRADGSSKFGSNNKYAFFPSAALAWKVSDEDFLKGNTTVSNLKLRTSYGLSGNSELPAYQSLAILANNFAIINDTRVTGIGIGRLANPDLVWEKTAQFDGGLELGLFNNRVNLEADIYYRKTTDMLLDAPVPRTTGYAVIRQNVGSMENKGLNLGINTINIQSKDFTWKTSFNISMNRNKVLSLATPDDIFGVGNPNFTNQTGIIRVGEPVGSFWGLVRLGTWSEAERTEAAKFVSYRGGKPILPGDIKYLDVNGDHAITDADRQIIGNGMPKGWGSLSNNFRYKNLDLIVELQYSYGNDVLNMTHHSGEDRQVQANSFSSVLDAWTPQNQNTPIAAIRDQSAGYVTNVDTHWLEDGSFIRGKNLLLGYTFNSTLVEKLRLNRLRVYASVQNFFLATKYTGNDPEVTTYGNAFAQGQTFFDYPKPTTFMVGLNIGL
ncbi:SusC/RagA family TonB-linked outer membrane protein [Pedobacter mucosus]|uniref:SusC/RagA family TonB-linked outer membrane protein n=1 Tax=Pedobacter mucosus TaxID=2895286 RepID=UPI001EE4D394|nr:TonB-dependent receptor [Pedobacter mucosus]UKT62781.1 TonB-dependent receptor [Pedobacter mucosus]